MRTRWLIGALVLLAGCDDGGGVGDDDAGPPVIAEGIFAVPGEVRPSATAEQRATFVRGEAVAQRRYSPEEGLGPLFNVTFCGACHEKPVFGGAAGHYRNFTITGQRIDEGTFITGGDNGGVLVAYSTDADNLRPSAGDRDNVFALRNPIPFFGLGLLAEIDEAAILANEDPDDVDGDGISGRANFDRGFVGRFGLKAQTVDIEGFIRGPLNNHVGITSNPLSQADKARLPVPSNNLEEGIGEVQDGLEVQRFHQAAAPSEPLSDDDDAPDPELSAADLFDLVSWAMLLGAPLPAEPTEQSELGRVAFAELNCTGCHVPVLVSPRGGIPVYSDLLLHDMGDELADSLPMGIATGREFRTSPLWGVAVSGPWLHDGRADTLKEAILAHGGEAERSRDAFSALDETAQTTVIAFLESLGGAEVATDGLILPDTPIPRVGAPGGPSRQLSADEEELWLAGRAVFDRDMPISEGLGPVFNGDSCRACHFDPVVGGSGPLGVNVMRHGMMDEGVFVPPEGGTVLFKFHVPGAHRPEAVGPVFYEPRQTPTVLGVGILSRISPEAIVAGADPTDDDSDGIRGIAHILSDGRVGRLGWKAQVPSAEEFVRDAMTGELGFTLPAVEGRSFGALADGDEAADPELSLVDYQAIVFFVNHLAAPAPVSNHPAGKAVFDGIGCTGCHVERLMGMDPDAPSAYTNLLLHDVSPEGSLGIKDGLGDPGMFQTPPLWGLSGTGPYMHDGRSSSVEAAIMAHHGEATTSREGFEALSAPDREAMLMFLNGL